MKSLQYTAPVAERRENVTRMHGKDLLDHYGWLREKEAPEVIAHLNRENEHTAAVMVPTLPLQELLYKEMLSHIQETDVSVPYRDRGWSYFTRTIEGLQYPIYCRTKASSEDAQEEQIEEILLDVNHLAKGHSYMALGGLSVSPDGWLLAYSTDNTGFRQYTLHVRDLRTGNDLPASMERTGSFSWAADSATLFYTVEDEVTKRQNHLYRHNVGDAHHQDVLVFEEKDERFNIGIGKSRDGLYLMLESGSHTTNEFRFIAASQPLDEFRLLAGRLDDQEYYPEHRDGEFLIRTNDQGKNFRVVRCRAAAPSRENWKEFVPLKEQEALEDFEAFSSFCVLSYRREGLPILQVKTFSGDSLAAGREIEFPEPTYTAMMHINREFEVGSFRYSYQSLVSPASVYEYEVASGTSKLLKQQEVPGGFEAGRYGSERFWATAQDGERIPVSIVYRRDMFMKDGRNPLYLYGYGSYGYALPVGFSSTRLSLLDRGLVMAYAHIRGGGEMGDRWHDAGKMMVKKTTFSDFIAATEQMVQAGFGDRNRIAIEGGSAGGLLMGAVVNERPELFSVVLSHVPFVDVMNTMLDASLPLTVAEYEEWGNPNELEAFDYMLSYSPYDNLKEGKYPAMLVKTSLNDSQVMYWEPAKYVAKLRTLKTNDTPLLLHINMEAGHGGASGRYDYLKETAFDYAFLLTQLGVEKANA